MEVKEILLTEPQAAKASNLSPRTLFSLRKSGELPFVRIGTKCIRYRVSDIEALAAKFLVTTTSK
jgi:predicted DNA-binding transcriptional regulator AlpA